MTSTGISARANGDLSLSSAPIQLGRTVRFMGAASAVAFAIALSTAAAAQAVPADCAAPSPLASGSTIVCDASATIVGPVSVTGVDDLTVVVGNADTATTLTSGAADTAVELIGAGDQTLTVTNAGSAVTGADYGAYMGVTGGAGALTVNAEGAISGGDVGIRAYNYGTGVTNITTADVTGGTGRGVDVDSEGGDVTVDTTAGTVSGGTYGIYVDQFGSGGINITTADVAGESEAGIYAWASNSAAGDIVIDTTGGLVASDNDGFQVTNHGSGDVSITTANVVGTDGDGIDVYSDSFSGESTGGNVVINTLAGTITGGDNGIDVESRGPGDISITTANVTGTYGDGISVDAGSYYGESSSAGVGGNIAINTVAGSVTGGDNGIDVRNEGSGSVSIVTADVTSVGSPYVLDGYTYTNSDSAIEVYNGNYAAGVTINTVAGNVDGSYGGIDVRHSGAGLVDITTSNVSGGEGIGIEVWSGEDSTGGVTINTVAGAVTGGEAGISVENAGAGGIQITTGDVSATGGLYGEAYSPFGGAGIIAQNGGYATGGISIDTTAGTVNGGIGILALNAGQGDIDITTADVNGGLIGVLALNGYYDGEAASLSGVTINTVAGTVVGGAAGVVAQNAGAGGIQISTGDVSVTGLYGEGSAPFGGTGIHAQNGGNGTGGIAIDTTAGTVDAVGNGIYAANQGQGDIDITTADVNGGLVGVLARNDYYGEGAAPLSGVTINTVAGAVVGGEAGILVQNAGAGGIQIATGDVSATGLYGEAYSPFSGTGIRAQNGGNSTGGIAIDTTAGTVNAVGVGIYAENADQGGIDITTADVNGDFAGVVVRNYSGEAAPESGVTINTVAGAVVGGEAGILVQNAGAGGIQITTGDVSATGGLYGEAYSPFSGVGVLAANGGNSTGGISIDSTAGTVSAVGVGVYAVNQGQGGIDITTADVNGDVVGVAALNGNFFGSYYGEGVPLSGVSIDTTAGAVTGTYAGIYAINGGVGALTIATHDVAGGEAGIMAINGPLSDGGINITSSGTVSANEIGINAQALAGGISITANNVTSVTGPAILASINSVILTAAFAPLAAGDELIVNVNGTVTGGSAGILLENFGPGTSTVNNAGVLSATDGPAILALGAPVTVNNAGTLNGFVTLTDGDDLFNNTGLFNAGIGSDFGAGADVFNNSGTVAVTTQTPVALAGLEGFSNSGLVDLRNGQSGTVLTLPGDYVGSGNALVALDVENAASGAAADVLVIAGAATGQTGVVVNVLGSAGSELGLENLVLVDAGAGSSASAFTIATGLEEQGFLRLGVRFDGDANNYLLAVGPSLAAHRTSMYAEGMRNLWYKSADSWTRHMASVRSAPVAQGTSYWISAVGEYAKRDNLRAIAFNDAIEIHDLGYNQDYFGAQLGVDLNGGSGFNFGITGGYLSSTQKFNGSSDRVKYNTVNIGAYAGFTSGIVFANVLGKYDHVWADARSIGGQFDESLKGEVYGARAEVGLTFGDPTNGFYVEPAASISYIATNLDRLVTEQGSIEFVEDEGLLGKLGGRVGFGGFAGSSVYLGGNWVHEFAGDDRVNLRTAGRTFSITNSAERDYAEGMVGLNIGDQSGKASGTFELRYADGGDHQGFGAAATVNFKF